MKREYRCNLKSVSDINLDLRDQMYRLLDAHFYNVTRERFEADLADKDLVFLLQELDLGNLLGFSTQKLMTTINGERVVFSGDTIIDPSAWGSVAFPRAWGHWMLRMLSEDSEKPLYWLLISKGHRTYRYLSTFFLDYSPSMARNYSLHEKQIIADIGGTLFGNELTQNEQGYFFVRPNADSQFLREHLLDSNGDRSKRTEIDFFERINPHYRQGAELVCLLNFNVKNMRPFCKRLLSIGADIDVTNSVSA